MSKNKEKLRGEVIVTETFSPDSVLMKFSEHKYYNDLNSPMFEAHKVYEIAGAEWIQRWIKRGGEIVERPVQTKKPMPQKIEGSEDFASDEL